MIAYIFGGLIIRGLIAALAEKLTGSQFMYQNVLINRLGCAAFVVALVVGTMPASMYVGFFLIDILATLAAKIKTPKGDPKNDTRNQINRRPSNP